MVAAMTRHAASENVQHYGCMVFANLAMDAGMLLHGEPGTWRCTPAHVRIHCVAEFPRGGVVGAIEGGRYGAVGAVGVLGSGCG